MQRKGRHLAWNAPCRPYFLTNIHPRRLLAFERPFSLQKKDGEDE